jgi:hypothetical protein
MNFLNKSFGFSSAVLFCMIGLFSLSCETVINPTLQSAAPVLVVDGWVNNKFQKQIILLTLTQPYFNDAQPAGVSGATVSVQDVTDGTLYIFNESPTVKGSYEWTPITSTFGAIGHNYKLTMMVNGEVFEAASHMGRVPPVDSITFELDQNNRSSNKTRYTGEFWATDPKGVGDCYWIKATVNDTLLTLPTEINTAYDAGLSAGGEADGVTFLLPIRRGITPDRSNQTGDPSPFWPGDSVYVEINSITVAAFNYLGQVVTQTNRPDGFGELFATPLANVSTNITNTNPSGSSAVGFFNVAAVSGRGQKFIKVD